MRKQGFTLIELLIVITVIGILAAIAIPNLLTALQKGKQKSTLGDMKSIGTAIESYMTDNGMAPGAGAATLVLHLEPYLNNFHSKKVPTRDGWQEAFIYVSGAVGPEQSIYSVISYGRDRASTGINPAYSFYIVNTMESFNNDICFSNGTFTYRS
ncbi:MAG: prepilin-type N-terminal cleavage/methylation domain-containing protein, partial [bacterium]|nr:prepilin-type N-terminal cleavage/methylation domain-containing protein [bacterium]